jgi:[methyl-Co(III) methanol-specific corrinoid protein]:coenzyme M methyltransferase
MNSAPRARVLAALRRERLRPVPAGAVTQPATIDQMEACGAAWPEAHRDAAQMTALAETAHTLLDFDLVRVPFDQTIEAELLGATVDLGSRGRNCAVRRHPFTFGEPVPPLPDLDGGRAGVVLCALALLRQRTEAAGVGGTVGPFTLVTQMFGAVPVLMAALRSPEALRPYLEFAVQFLSEYACLQFEAGADAICIEDMSASLDLTSPAIYGAIVLPAQQALIASIPGPVILHVCGGNTKILDLMQCSGAAALSLDARTDLSAAAAGNACAVVGGVPTVEALLNGSAEEVRRACAASLAAGVHVLAPACGIPPETPLENLREMVCAARSWTG